MQLFLSLIKDTRKNAQKFPEERKGKKKEKEKEKRKEQ
jgi:hypothetical protein